MNHIERIDAVLTQQPTDRTPFALVDGGAWVSQNENKSYNQLYHMADGGASVFAGYMDEIDTDTISGVNGVFTAALNAFGCDIDIDKVGSPVNTAACIKDMEKEIPELDISDIRGKLLANDFMQCMMNQCENIKKIVGDTKYVHVDIAGPFTVACVMCGTADFMVLLMKNPDLAKQMMEYSTAVSTEILRLLREKGADISFIAEPCSAGNMISPKMAKKWAIPYLKRVIDALDFKYNICHVCGPSGQRAASLAEVGFNAFSCDYAVDLKQAIEDGGGKLTLFGNMNPAGNLLMGTAQEVYDEACERISTVAGSSYILAPGCDLGSESPMENVLMMSKACKDMAK